ncbi:ATP-binding cassette domain-containing protein [Aeoliella sp. SH292]|uniref:ATP-binding cassette domain-containing protein n=1 Tax=Aeoliella sp. SH292 TaxID=3454464 RepID=UPI003F9D9871
MDFTLCAGEVHALCGENGAGKTTLIKVMSGFYVPDEGRVEVGGQHLPASVHAASELGVSVIYQESIACLDLDAVDNIFVGRELGPMAGQLLDRKAMLATARALFRRLGQDLPLNLPLGELSTAQRQIVCMARALSQKCRVLVLDEPTASLSSRECELLFRIVEQLRDEGVGIVYVSHRMEEVFALADRVTVLRDGALVSTRSISEITEPELVALMVGRETELLAHLGARKDSSSKEECLAVRNITQEGTFADISFDVRRGEIVGLAGLVGSGRSEVANAIFGVSDYDSGTVLVDGKPLPKGSLATSIERGLALVPEDRQHMGLVLPMSVSANLTLAVLRSLTRFGLIRRRAENTLAASLAEEMRVRAANLRLPANALSGGNQQKLVLGKWLATKPKLLMLDEPTRGVDVAAKAEIHRRIRDLTDEGMATLVISSELPEILGLCDRILVMREGRIAGELRSAEATEEKILELALPARAADATKPELQVGAKSVTFGQRLRSRRETWLAMMVLAVCLMVGWLQPSFLNPSNLLDVLASAAPTAIVACAVMLVIVTGEIDISVGSIVGLASAVLGLCCYGPAPYMSPAAGAACALLVAVAVGMFNGAVTAWGRVPSIVVTLGTLTVVRGATKMVMKGHSIEGRPDVLRDLATGTWMGVPISVWIAGLVGVVAALMIRYTAFGRRVFAVGSNPSAAPLLGVSVGWTKFLVFTLSGFLAGLAAILLAPKNSIIQPNIGENLELLVVTCVVVGGASILGGRGTVLGVLLAVVLLELVPTTLTYVGAPPQWRLAIQGAFILVAVLADQIVRRQPRHVRSA